MKECNHDFENAIRKGRAFWICPKCQEDITIDLVYLSELNLDNIPKP